MQMRVNKPMKHESTCNTRQLALMLRDFYANIRAPKGRGLFA